MKILSWNICCLPNVINLYQNPKLMIHNIITTLQYYDADIICLQEVFDTYCIKELKNAFSSYTIIYDTKGPRSAINSGLMTLSKHPLIDYGYHEYRIKCGEDRMSCKGFMYCAYRINKRDIIIYNTHLNNDTPLISLFSNSTKVIQRELEQLFVHVYKTSKVCKHIFVCGDFNSEPYRIKTLLNTFYATKHIGICGFEHEPTLGNTNKTIDHILYVSHKHNVQSIQMTQQNYNYPIFSDHYLLEKQIKCIP